MALGLGGQFLLLLWKELLLARRKPCSLVFQFVLPLAFAAFLVVLRLLVNNDNISETVWTEFQVNNFTTKGTANRTEILYFPNNSKATQILNDVQTNMGGSFTVTGFATEALLESHQDLNTDTVWAAVVFDTSSNDYSSTIPNQVKYTLRVARENAADSWRTANTYPFFRVPGYRNNQTEGGAPNYYSTGFLTLQYQVGRSVINIQSGNTNFDNLNFYLKKMPYRDFIQDNLLSVLQVWLPFFVMLSFIITALQTTKGVTYEKEKRLKESMKLMGMNEAMYWFSIFTKAMVFLLIASGFFILCMFVKTGSNGSVFNYSDGSLIFVFFILYDIALITFCIMLSSFFNKANTASYAGGLLYFGFFFPWFFLNSEYETMTAEQKFASCLPFNTAMAIGFNIIGIHEGTGEGAQWDNFYKTPSVDDNFTLGGVMLVLVLDIVIHLLITWYVGNVFPGEFGMPRPFYFPFTKSYWGCGKSERDFDKELRHSTANPKFFERDPPDMKAGISINKLRKEFGSGKNKKVAVEGTTLNIYEGQITALLGHNGAGKTTTMSMLTGFIPPSSGTAKVNGYDIMTQIDKVRQSIGLCPQHDILFETMTVKEHLEYFCKLKGTPKKDIDSKVTEMIKVLGMVEKTNYAAGNLSGGQKRKLSVGIAIIGDSKIIILDEPTSGMDPAARRQTWDILQKFRENRTMVLSTHFMDEADLLGDRIAIMAEGVVKCVGTSLFLKKAFGAGYHLVMVKDKSCNVSNVTQLVQSHVGSAILESEISAELSYLLPFDQSKSFSKLFADVEQKKSSLGIQSFGTTATTMEEVFLKVGESGKEDVEEEADRLATQAHLTPQTPPPSHVINPAFEHEGEKIALTDVSNGVNGVSNGETKKNGDNNLSKYVEFNKELKKNKGMALTLQQFKSMLIKKAIHSWRNRIVTFVQLVLPVIFTILALVIELNSSGFSDEPALNLDLSSFENPVTIYNNPGNTIATKYKDLFLTAEDASSATSYDRYVIDKMKEVGMSAYSKKYIVGLDDNGATATTTYFNGDPFHSPAIALGYTLDAILKAYKSSTQYSIQTVNYPFKRSLDANSNRVAGNAGSGFSIAFVILFGVAFLSTSFILFLIKERMSGSKHLQKVSGLSSLTYWLANFVWDYINYLFPAVMMVICFAAFRPDAYFLGSPSRIGLVFLVYILFGWASLPYTYVLHYLFKTPASGMVTITMCNILTGLATTLTIFLLMFPSFGTQDVALQLDWIFAIIFPHYNLGSSIMNIYTNYEYINTCENSNYQVTCQIPSMSTGSCCMDNCGTSCLRFVLDYTSMTYPGIGKYILMMVIQGAVYLLLVTLAELNFFFWIMYKIKGQKLHTAQVNSEGEIEGESLEEDVKKERKRINETEISKLQETDALVLKNLAKNYGRFRAVKGVSIGIPRQECFGLLGQNGAGKTTTFKMMTGDEIVTGGNAFLNKYDVKNNIKEVQQNLGYCPQFDALIDQMTGREILFMFARLRGVKEEYIPRVVMELIKVLMLEKYSDRQCGTYSGGNKRKLSTAISLIGDPPFVFLDEPTTGMDPGARRQLWNVLSQVRESGRTLILTSHSMEECDALCTRLVIMVNGQFVCLGSPQHLKNKFGSGYTLIVRLSADDSNPTAIKNFIKERFADSQIFDDHHGYVHFQIPDTTVSLSTVFGAMEEASSSLGLEDYSVHQTTLEQVFLTFTTNQVPPKEKTKDKGCCGLCTCWSLCACTLCCGDY
ncbi:phospholipid-transporting ATPase ABCA3-like [Ostrea edulis]|uniref:phospholipid-transporting ATPase ABCA3-like n=1 Tax=Ostrea edulis TaxID=37623 RepID=UPI0024AF1113|nr:phospholipid-transporting ATPase ABCA3-like [Ostrea edulis]XP_048742100.2 phospholipid-transporting ATPase ABCA3-like [Ostrea edulis]